jgi:alpha-D-xyloside xylohydrolase
MPRLSPQLNPAQRLETRHYLRRLARAAGQPELDGPTACIRTTARAESYHPLSSADPRLLAMQSQGSEVAGEAGTWQCDLLEAGILRVRYRLDSSSVKSPSHMLLSQPEADRQFSWQAESDGALSASTPLAQIQVRPDTLRVEVRSPAGLPICAWGGDEKNRFSPWCSASAGVSLSLPEGRPLAHEAFDLSHDEAIWGFGESFGCFNQRGRSINLALTDPLGVNTLRRYKAVPFWISSRGYGVFFHHSARLYAWIGSLSATDLQIAVDDDYLDFFVFLGEPAEILERYTRLTGRAEAPPSWSFGLIQGKCSYQSAAEADAVVKLYQQAGVRLGSVHLDTHWFATNWLCDLEFSKDRFPDPAGWMSRLADQGVQVCLWQLPYLPEGTALFDEIASVDGFVKRADGTLYDLGICYVKGFTGRVGLIDYTNPAATRVHQRWLMRVLQLGAAFIKTDFGEDAPADGVYFDETPGHRMANLYPLLYNQAVADATREVHGHRFVWARSAWSGGQRFPAHWNGDASANWSNLQASLAGGLSFGMSGFAYWTHDVGGFLGKAEPKLFIRWLQAALLCSHLRLHAAGRDCEIDKWGEECLSIARGLLALRESLLPYLESSAATGAARGLPLLRPLALAFPRDRNTWSISDQFLAGDDLLAAPVVTPEDQRDVYFPSGQWRCHWTGAIAEGPCWSRLSVPLEQLPLWHRITPQATPLKSI